MWFSVQTGVGLNDPYWSLPTQDILCFYGCTSTTKQWKQVCVSRQCWVLFRGRIGCAVTFGCANIVMKHTEVLIQGWVQALCHESGRNRGGVGVSLPPCWTQVHRLCPTAFVFTFWSDLVSMRKLISYRFVYFKWIWDTFQSATLTAWEKGGPVFTLRKGTEEKRAIQAHCSLPTILNEEKPVRKMHFQVEK